MFCDSHFQLSSLPRAFTQQCFDLKIGGVLGFAHRPVGNLRIWYEGLDRGFKARFDEVGFRLPCFARGVFGFHIDGRLTRAFHEGGFKNSCLARATGDSRGRFTRADHKMANFTRAIFKKWPFHEGVKKTRGNPVFLFSISTIPSLPRLSGGIVT